MIMTTSPWVAESGKQLLLSESKQYFMVTSGTKTWYWSKADGEFDGTSWDMKEPRIKPIVEVGNS